MDTSRTYYIGLDIGTDSVGWAVTDPDYGIIRKNGKDLWGSHAFEAAKTAKDRRSFRTLRRRLERRKQRLNWLQELFAEEIGRVDPAFFQRLRESKYPAEDKRDVVPLGKNALFADLGFCDSVYHRVYPTIYHLRMALMENPGPFDVRLVYLALHHIMKYRGHFLYGDLPMENITLEAGLERLRNASEQLFDSAIVPTDLEGLRAALTSRTPKANELAKFFGLSRTDGPCYQAINLLSGAKVSLRALFGEEFSDQTADSICLKESEQDPMELAEKLGDRLELILAVKEIYDWARLETMLNGNMLNGKKYLSCAKVNVYERHREDLRRLKNAIRATGDGSLYREMFRTARKDLDNYPAYSGKGASNHRCDYEKFRKYTERKLKNHASGHPEI